MKYNLLLTPTDSHKSFVLPVRLSYSEAISIRDTCLAEIAKGTKESRQWADVDIVPDGWPNVNRLGVPDREHAIYDFEPD
jgi:hypothetical protein